MTVSLALDERPISETYHDVQGLMYATIQKFQRLYGGDFEEWVSEGNEIFMKAYQRYDVNKGKFTTWFGFFLYKLFMEKIRRQAMKAARRRQVFLDLDAVEPKKKKSFDCGEFLQELSDDARTVAMLVLDTPADIKLIWCEQRHKKSLRDRTIDGMVEFLTDMGWSQDKVFDAFDEIQSALC